MKAWSLLLSAALIAASCNLAIKTEAKSPNANAKKESKTAELPKQLTGMDTNVSVQLLKVVRANVEEFGRNNIVVVQFRLKKEGASAPGPKTKAWFDATDIKLRDSLLGSSYPVIRGAGHQHNTYSDTAQTNEWTVGQTGDGYAWLKVPDDVKTVDIFMPYTKGFMQVPIEVPKG